MKNYVVESYENYKEEERLTTQNSKKIEFITTIRVLEEYLSSPCKILDCAAGTGIYSFYFANKGFDVTATDITPRHIKLINLQKAKNQTKMQTAVLDATDMSVFEDETFDVVLNMGPFYHLILPEQRHKCLSECYRVLKKGGLLITAYIPRFFVFQYVAVKDSQYFDAGLAKQLVNTGVLKHDDDKCFWTDTYYSSMEEMETMYRLQNLELIDHFAQDGITPLLSQYVDDWSEEKFKIWCDYFYSICREKSLLGASNHSIIIGKK